MLEDFFRKFAQRTAALVGAPWTFALAVLALIVWAVSGPLFGFSNTWQLIINTGTTIVTFLTVFLIQHTQNRDNKALQLKLDELIRANDKARNRIVDLEDVDDAEIKKLQEEFRRLRQNNTETPD